MVTQQLMNTVRLIGRVKIRGNNNNKKRNISCLFFPLKLIFSTKNKCRYVQIINSTTQKYILRIKAHVEFDIFRFLPIHVTMILQYCVLMSGLKILNETPKVISVQTWFQFNWKIYYEQMWNQLEDTFIFILKPSIKQQDYSTLDYSQCSIVEYAHVYKGALIFYHDSVTYGNNVFKIHNRFMYLFC